MVLTGRQPTAPQIQNLYRPTEEVKRLREAFKVKPLDVDFSDLELRVIANELEDKQQPGSS